VIHFDTHALVSRLKTIESLAVIPRVASTNLIARRVVTECIENELSLPQAMIIAGEQFAGMGRNGRQWSSPAGKGIYATALLTRPATELPIIPLAMANTVATYLRDVFAIDARIKWPNDVIVGRRKIAGILTEARVQDDRVFLIIGVGVNVEPLADDIRPNAVSIREVSPGDFAGIQVATVAFIEHVDERFAHPFDRQVVLDEWQRLTIHRAGDRIEVLLGDRTVAGTWRGIDEHGRALIQSDGNVVAVSAGDLLLA